uniref:Uncharacterized protein n=1 Tax=Anguilla anguilla TaxID=7936 RepID=A0A0E9PKS1_ANGAN
MHLPHSSSRYVPLNTTSPEACHQFALINCAFYDYQP